MWTLILYTTEGITDIYKIYRVTVILTSALCAPHFEDGYTLKKTETYKIECK